MDGGRRIAEKIKAPRKGAGKAAAQHPKKIKQRRQNKGFWAHIARMSVPAGLGTLASVGFICCTLFYGFYISDEKEAWAKRATLPFDVLANFAGFKLDKIEVTGLNRLGVEDIHKALDISTEASTLLLDVEKTREKIARMPLVEDVTVRKLLPHDLYIHVTERTPFAVWQQGGKLALVSKNGTILSTQVDDRYRDLPFVVGEGADKRLEEAAQIVQSQLSLRSRIRAISLVANRRWNLITHEGVVVRLPEGNAAAAMTRLASLEHEGSILSKDILSIDLRMEDRAVVRLTEKAAQDRAVTTASILKRKPL